MKLQNPYVGVKDESLYCAATNNASGTNHQPISHDLRAALLFTSPFYAVINVLATFFVYTIFNDKPIKKFRICIFPRLLAIVDILLVLVTLGPPWVELFLPPDYTWTTGPSDRACFLYVYCRLSLEDARDIILYMLVTTGMLYACSRICAPSHRIRVTCIIAMVASVFWMAMMAVMNLYLLYGNRTQSADITNLEQCLNTRRITGDKNGPYRARRLHAVLGGLLAAGIPILGCSLTCRNRPSQHHLQYAVCLSLWNLIAGQ